MELFSQKSAASMKVIEALESEFGAFDVTTGMLFFHTLSPFLSPPGPPPPD